MAHASGHGQGQSLLVEIPSSGGPADSAASPLGGVGGDGARLGGWAARKNPLNRVRHPDDQFAILLLPKGVSLRAN
jgi:hypothetical protein